MGKHTNFICTPVISILDEAVSAFKGVGNGIATYPLQEYIMHSVFLKMTGFQEQKMKSICWELATNDYDYRVKTFLNDRNKTFSDYKEKNFVYNDLINEITKREPLFDTDLLINKISLRNRIYQNLNQIYSKSTLFITDEHSFQTIDIQDLLPTNQFAVKVENIKKMITTNKLFENEENNSSDVSKKKNNDLYKRYNLLYLHRNRLAHNTQSYQENLPTLSKLADPMYKFDNYYVRFALLTLIDEIIILLYNKYLITLENSYF